MAASSSREDHLEDVFQNEILKAFADFTEFKKFARASKGLCLDDHVIDDIVEDNGGCVVDQKLKMLNMWRQNTGKQATAWNIRNLVSSYKGDDPEDYISLDDGRWGLYRNQHLCEEGHVYFGVQKSEITGSYFCAIKLQPKTKNNLREAQILSKLRNHVNVVSILHAGIYRAGLFDYIFIAMDLSWTKTVRNMLEESDRLGIPFNEFISTNLVRQISKAVGFIHSNNIIHRDLKPENVLVSEDWCNSKVTDFEFSKTYVPGFSTKQTSVNIGTDGYRSAETYNIEVKITSKSDVFSLGVIIAEILANGKHPFGTNQYIWSNNIINNKNLDLGHLLVSNRAQVIGLIKRMMEIEPEKRPTAEKVQNEIQQFKTWSQLKNQQTTADQSPAKTSMAQLPITQKVLPTNTNAIILFNRGDKHIYSYKPTTKEWNKMQESSELLENNAVTNVLNEFTALVSGKHIYVLHYQEMYQLEYSEPASKWKQMLSMPKYHGTAPSAAELNGLIYVCGGRRSRSVERYDVARNQWEPISDIQNERHSPCVVATKDHVYCIGGWVDESVERYDEISNQWEFVEPAPRLVEYANAAVVNNRIYVADNKGVLCYNIQKNSWSEINQSNEVFFLGDYEVKILAVNEELYFMGLIYDDNDDFGWSSRNSRFTKAICLLEPETGQMTLVEEFSKSGSFLLSGCVAVKL